MTDRNSEDISGNNLHARRTFNRRRSIFSPSSSASSPRFSSSTRSTTAATGAPTSSSPSWSSLWSLSSRTMTMRVCFVLSLSAAAVVCGLVAHRVIANLEQEVAEQTYESVASSALEGAQTILQRKFRGGAVLASVLAYAYPNASEWPLQVAYQGYEVVAEQVANLSVSTAHSLAVLVQPEQVAAFEAFAQRVYRQHGYPAEAGRYDGGFGIWKFDDNDGNIPIALWNRSRRIHDTTGETSYQSPWKILAPMFLHNNRSVETFMFNIHSAPLQGSALDWMHECTQKYAATRTTPSCDVLTDFLQLIIQAGPSGILLQPVYPVDDPTTLVGVIGTSLQWEHVLMNVVPDYVDGLDCVIATETASYTFVIEQGIPVLKGPGDWHDPRFDRYARNITLNYPNTNLVPSSTTSATYRLTVYPTDRMLDLFQTNSPRVVSLGLVSIILVCIALFFLYDFFMKYEAHQRRQLLEMKRRFVRFISHEIRTPLNCVCMGLELLQDDLRAHAGIHRTQQQQQQQQQQPGQSSEPPRRPNHPDDSSPDSTEVETDYKDPVQIYDKGRDNKTMPELKTSLLPTTKMTPSRKPSASKALQGNVAHPPSSSPPPPPHRLCVEFAELCLELTSDVYENTKNAVAVLDDLLNYDKIQTGTLKLEIDKVRIWDMVRKTVVQFKLQAQNKKIALQTCINQQTSHLTLQRQPEDDNDPEDNAAQDQNQWEDELDDIVFDTDPADNTLPHTQVYALGDELKLSQALRNLISNALKFTPEGGTVAVNASYSRQGLPKAKPLTDAGAFATYPRSGSALIRVHDTGAGMSADQLKLLFQEWVQFDANKLQNGGGSGLGLCITKEIIEQHGGTITAESDGIGKGSTFIIELPLYEGPRENSPQAKKPANYQSNNNNNDEEEGTCVDDSVGNTTSTAAISENIIDIATALKPVQHRILIVEDVISNRKLLVRLLERAGHVCAVASNGQEAIDCYLADQAAAAVAAQAQSDPSPYVPFDTILMDSEMPVMSGPDATKQLRELGCTAFIIGVTGNVLPSDVQFFKSHGADEVLAKPVDISLLEDFWTNRNRNQE